MDCREAKQILPQHIEDNSPPGQKALIEEHLQSCKQCRLYAAELRKTLETLQGLEEVEPPAWLTNRVMQKIREEAPSRKRWIERLFFPLHIKLPIEAIATLLITVAAIIIYRNIGPGLRQIEVKSQAPVTKSMPAESDTEIQKQEAKLTQRPREEAKQKDNSSAIEPRELKPLKEDKFVEQPTQSPATPPVPAPSSAMRQLEAGKAPGMTAQDETIQRYAPAAPSSELAAEKKVQVFTTLTLRVKAVDAAKKDIATYLADNNGEMKPIEQSESRIIIEVKLDPSKTKKFLAHLDSMGKIKEDRQALSQQIGLFKLIIDKQ